MRVLVEEPVDAHLHSFAHLLFLLERSGVVVVHQDQGEAVVPCSVGYQVDKLRYKRRLSDLTLAYFAAIVVALGVRAGRRIRNHTRAVYLAQLRPETCQSPPHDMCAYLVYDSRQNVTCRGDIGQLT